MAISSDIWFSSQIETGVEVLVRITSFQEADGGPGQEFDLIGAVYLDPIHKLYTARVAGEELIGYSLMADAKEKIKEIIKRARP